MKRTLSIFNIIVAVLLICAVTMQAQTKVTKWGSTPRGTNGWTILNTATTPDGSGSMGGTAQPTGWMSIKGGFNTLTATTTQAFVITGTFEFVGGGGGSSYTWLRFALFNEDGVLNNQNTPTAVWTEDSNANGYIFTPVTGTGTISNTYNTWPSGSQGTNWPLINSKGWTSTNSNGGGPFGTVLQAPNRQVASAGVYDFAISVQPLANGSNQVTWYFVQQHSATSQNYYWWGGTLNDPTPGTKAFNSIGFACNNDLDATCKQVNLANVTVSLGSPVTVPTAPWQAFYVDQWGSTPRGTNGWTILNDANTVIGNASMGGTAKPTGWMSIKGSFNPVTLVSGKAMSITGTFEFVGGGANSAYTWLRYALFNEDGKLTDQNKPTAMWSEDSNGNGYIFTPVTGTGIVSNTYNTWPQGSQGTNWPLINSKGWTSTNSNGGGPYMTVMQAPARQVAVAGVYDFCISVQPLSTGGNQVSWYFIQQHTGTSQNYYWWGGTLTDAVPLTTKFNSIGFACNNDLDATCTQVNLKDVKVDMGNAITVPDPPFATYYVDQWALYGDPGTLSDWRYTAQSLVGNAMTAGTANKSSWSALRGEFLTPVKIISNKSLVVTGKIKLAGGGFETTYSLRFGVFATAAAGAISNGRWNGTEIASGYLMVPPSGLQNAPYWTASKAQGTFGGIVNSYYAYPVGANDVALGKPLQSPGVAVGTAGVYNFAISVTPQADGSNEVRSYLIDSAKAGKGYYWAAKGVDKAVAAVVTKWNSVIFRTDGNPTTSSLLVTDVKLDQGNAIDIPKDPNLVGVETTETLPTEFSLSQNYPNPFNPSTNIKFTLPKDSDVRLTVHDVLGRVVAELVNGQLKAGQHEVNFNATNLSSGVYFYRINAGDFTSVKKLMLLK